MIKNYFVNTLQISVLLWMILIVGVVASSLLYGILRVNGVSENTGLSYAFVTLVVLILIGSTIVRPIISRKTFLLTLRSGADLRKAKLSRAHLSRAKLSRVDF